MAKERGVCNLLLPAVRDTQKHELAHEIPQTRAISVCPPDNTEGSKKQTEKTLNLDSGNGQFKITPEIHGFDKDPYQKCTNAVVKINLNFVSSNSFRGILSKNMSFLQTTDSAGMGFLSHFCGKHPCPR